jgi:hypothetical protein
VPTARKFLLEGEKCQNIFKDDFPKFIQINGYSAYEAGMTFFILAKWVQNSVKNYPLFERSEHLGSLGILNPRSV